MNKLHSKILLAAMSNFGTWYDNVLRFIDLGPKPANSQPIANNLVNTLLSKVLLAAIFNFGT